MLYFTIAAGIFTAVAIHARFFGRTATDISSAERMSRDRIAKEVGVYFADIAKDSPSIL